MSVNCNFTNQRPLIKKSNHPRKERKNQKKQNKKLNSRLQNCYHVGKKLNRSKIIKF